MSLEIDENVVLCKNEKFPWTKKMLEFGKKKLGFALASKGAINGWCWQLTEIPNGKCMCNASMPAIALFSSSFLFILFLSKLFLIGN